MSASTGDLAWGNDFEQFVVSPAQGGRILSWKRGGVELVLAPVILEGGLLRVLFAEEQYPGTSFTVPHEVIDYSPGPHGFRIHLRHLWNAANAVMRAAGWPEKTNELHLDGLLLDKIVSYDATNSCLVCEVSVTNLTKEKKFVTPWVHLSYAPWPNERWMVKDGKPEQYQDTDVYWGSHLAGSAKSMRMVHKAADGSFFTVLGAATTNLKGMCGMLPVPGEFYQATGELRHTTIELDPGKRWRANCFLAVTHNWQWWADRSPVDLFDVVEDAGPLPKENTVSLLDHWLLPDEAKRGLMVLSFLDKPPFYSSERFFSSNSFAGFHSTRKNSEAWVMLYASRDLENVQVDVSGDKRWSIRASDGKAGKSLTLNLKHHDFVPLYLIGPSSLAGRDKVRVQIILPDGKVGVKVAKDAAVEARFPYHVRQMPAYLRERFDEKRGPMPGASVSQMKAWQKRVRARYRQWLEFNAVADCDRSPRLLERQEGPTCIREKWLLQTEPGIWVPGYLVRPKKMKGKRPLLYLLHGSGPGKVGYVPDEVANPPRTQFGNELEFMAYRLAVELSCQVYVPDGRGQGELGESNTGTWGARTSSLGINNADLRVADLTRSLDWLIMRHDVDPKRIGSLGSSGGGNMTYLFAAFDERVNSALVSSTTMPRPVAPLPEGYFHRMFVDKSLSVDPSGIQPLTGAPVGFLVAPRPMWIINGLEDTCIATEQWPAWRKSMKEGHEQIRSFYKALGAGSKFEETWFDGGHCAGMTVANAAGWFRSTFGLHR